VELDVNAAGMCGDCKQVNKVIIAGVVKIRG
jgi:hypothetical protein